MHHNLTDNGRGMCLYVQKDIQSTRCDDIDTKDMQEVMFVEYGHGEERTLIGLFYGSPNSSEANKAHLPSLIRSIDQLRRTYPRILLIGDFNYPDIDWNTQTCDKATTHPTSNFLIATQDYFLSQIQLQPTRVRDGQASNCLDLVLTSTEELVTEIDILPGIGKSDHLTLRLDLRHTNASKQATFQIPERKLRGHAAETLIQRVGNGTGGEDDGGDLAAIEAKTGRNTGKAHTKATTPRKTEREDVDERQDVGKGAPETPTIQDLGEGKTRRGPGTSIKS